jgi:hypothetical protein
MSVYVIIFNCSTLWHCVDLTLCSTFFAFDVQCRLIFSCRLIFIVSTSFGLTGHLQVYHLLWWRTLRLNSITVSSSVLHHNKWYTWRWLVRPKHVVKIKWRWRENINQHCTQMTQKAECKVRWYVMLHYVMSFNNYNMIKFIHHLCSRETFKNNEYNTRGIICKISSNASILYSFSALHTLQWNWYSILSFYFEML